MGICLYFIHVFTGKGGNMMRKNKFLHGGVTLAVSLSMAAGVTLGTPAVAEAGIGNIIGAVIGGTIAASEMNKQIK